MDAACIAQLRALQAEALQVLGNPVDGGNVIENPAPLVETAEGTGSRTATPVVLGDSSKRKAAENENERRTKYRQDPGKQVRTVSLTSSGSPKHTSIWYNQINIEEVDSLVYRSEDAAILSRPGVLKEQVDTSIARNLRQLSVLRHFQNVVLPDLAKAETSIHHYKGLAEKADEQAVQATTKLAEAEQKLVENEAALKRLSELENDLEKLKKSEESFNF